MKKAITLTTTLLFVILAALSGMAQSTVLQGLALLDDRPSEARYVLLHIDQKDVNNEVKKYLTEFGKVVESQRNNFRVENPRSLNISDKLASVIVRVEEYKDLTKVYFFLLDKDKKTLGKSDLNDYRVAGFVENFAILANKNMEIRLGELDVKQAEEHYNLTLRNLKKVEKSLETNLKDQEKLGKKLDASPEEMARLIAEKEEITKKMYDDQETEIVQSTEEDLKKAAQKKEKEILKTQKEKEKNRSKLEKKEADFEKLRNELFDAKGRLKHAESILDNKKSNLRVLTK